VSHGGADAGYRSHFLRFPDQRLSVAVLCNFPTSDPGGRANRVAEAYLGELMTQDAGGSAPAAATATVPRAELAALAGWYRGELPHQVFRIRMEGDSLRLGMGAGQTLRPLGGSRFEIRGPGTVIVLTADSGSVPGTLEGGALGRARRRDPWEPSEAELRAFEGVYASAELGTEYQLVLEGSRLAARHRKLDDAPLTPAFRDAFLIRGALAVFTRDGSGAVAGFTLSDGRVWNVRFRKEGGASAPRGAGEAGTVHPGARNPPPPSADPGHFMSLAGRSHSP
jgi:hypothetical protein